MTASVQPSISVVLTAFRRTEFLSGALASALGQTLPPLEVIVTDDSAEPAIRALVESCGSIDVVRYRANRAPLGAAGNVRAALAECRGRLVAVLNDDDLWEPALLERLAEPLVRLPGVAAAFSDHWVIDGAGSIDVEGSRRFSDRYGRSALAEGVLADTPRVVIVRRSVPAAICTLFRREAVPAADIPVEVRGAYDFWLSALAASSAQPFYYVAARLARYRLHAGMESRRPSATGSEGHRAALAEIRHRGWFPGLRRELRRSWGDVHFDCGLERLLHGEDAAARAMFLKALRHRPSLRALAGLSLALAPELGRGVLERRRARAAA